MDIITSKIVTHKNRSTAATIVPDIEKLPPHAALTTNQIAALSNYSPYTFKIWRLKKQGRGPQVTYIDGNPRYLVKDVAAWMGLRHTA